ncbi:NAD(P)H-dependent amine dehydrogenase family protein [Mycolicibacterium komossense]|uniref:Dihydrodipicolinate reductase n=1 Tax=Mycolicibacterium komossense TaxID=1779 RepID=A0ABT3CG13_9MYCO|nr:dihydrodipicolinate reductase [Mycolicibacterium komossense]MCV7228414.1 dihydrodipicolinate reductase [Mycolicibacterium komossense]
MGSGALRIAVIASGGIGTEAIRAIGRRHDLTLTGLWVHSPAKVGVDAGELAGGAPVGVVATGALDDIIEAAPDCVVYAASGPDLDAAAVPDYVRLLSAGINVVTTSSPGLVFPDAWVPHYAEAVRAASLKGGASLYASGLEPGFAGDQLAVLLSTLSSTITSIRTQEIFDYSEYPNTFMMFDVFGFGRPMDYAPLMSLGGSQRFAWGPPVHFVAAALGVELDDIAETYERVEAPRKLEVAAGIIEEGTCGAIRMETIGIVGGRPAIVIEHVNRMAVDIAPQWPVAARDGTYRVVIEGTPSLTCELTIGDGDSPGEDGMIATTMRVVNAIPYVVAAPPGIHTALDLPVTAPLRPFLGLQT